MIFKLEGSFCSIFMNGVGGQSASLHLLVHSPNACKAWSVARLKCGARNPVQASLAGGRNPTAEAIAFDLY